MQADDGFLYPLERAFYYGHKPPILIPHEEVSLVGYMIFYFEPIGRYLAQNGLVVYP